MKRTACLVIALALMVMTVASSRYRRVRSRRTRKVYEDPNPCDQACYGRCCERGDCSGRYSNLKYVCASACGCHKRTLEDPNPCDEACHVVCCVGDYCGVDSNLKAFCDSKCGCRKRTLQGLMTERRRTFFEDPNPCDQACHDVCCEGECGTDSNLKAVCDRVCGCRKRTLEDPNLCDQACYDGCCQGECTAGSVKTDICSSECGCRKRTLQALKTKRGDEEYPVDTEYADVSPEECATCK